jgi:hypothetical protein
MTISKEVLDKLLKGVERPEDLRGDAGLMKELEIKLVERMLGAELTAHLGCEEGKEAPPGQTNRRNGASAKMLKGEGGELPLAVPRDRDSSFEPELVKGFAKCSGAVASHSTMMRNCSASSPRPVRRLPSPPISRRARSFRACSITAIAA